MRNKSGNSLTFFRVSISGSVTSIGSLAFYGCKSLTSVSIPGSVKRIDSCAFDGCTSLTSWSGTTKVTTK